MNRFYSLLALLLVGSASLQAQSDPFPDISTVAYKYYGTMTCTSQVVMNGEIVTDAVVAAYCGDDFRGKNSTGKDPDHPNHVFLTIYGDYTIEKQYIHFKVYMQGKIFTYNPDPAFVYTYNGIVGSTSNPYIIDITPVSLTNDADNTTTLTTHKDETCDIALTGRTIYKDGSWNTLCLPFTLTASEVNEHLENPTGLMTLSSSSFDSATGTLTLNFSNELENGIEAGKPYLVKWEGDGSNNLVNPVFENVIIGTNTTANVSTDYVDFIGNYDYMSFNADDRSILFLGADNTLYYPQSGASIGACRAYFQLKGLNAGDIQHEVKMYFGEDMATGIGLIPDPSPNGEGSDYYYTLDGVRLVAKPTKRGVYINNGRKVVIP